jgi:hypothetical protein
MAVSSTLLEEVKNYLDLTWADEDEDAKLTAQIERSMSYLTLKTGVEEEEFEVNSLLKDLLFNRILYDRAGRLWEFSKHYKSEILCLALKKRTNIETPVIDIEEPTEPTEEPQIGGDTDASEET